MIGVFDSGLGGLSVLAALARALPAADLVYLADSAHLPYGAKSDSFVRSRVLAIGEHLTQMGCEVLVVACNTATAAAIEALRAAHPGIPVVGVEPGVKPAALASRSGRIAILATESTSRSTRLERLIHAHANNIVVEICPCPGWATRVEALHIDDADFIAEVRATVAPLVEGGADQIVLGCTHYGFLKPAMTAVTEGRAQLLDVADAVARRAAHLGGDIARGRGALRLFATQHPEQLAKALPALGLKWLAGRAHGAPALVECPGAA